MTDPLADAGARWRAQQPPPPELDMDRITAEPARPGRPRWAAAAVAGAAAVVAVSVGAGLTLRDGSADQTAGRSPGISPINGEVRLVGYARAVAAGSTTARQVAQGQSAFGLDLLKRRCEEHPERNDVLSPASAALALGMLSTGAKGETRTAIERLLHLPTTGSGLPAAQQQQNQALHRLSQLAVSNHVFTQNGTPPQQGVLDELATAYGADLRVVDFARQPAQATAAINGSVDKDTRGLIPTLFDQPLGIDTVTVLTNALYLKAPWRQAFKAASPALFRTGDGQRVQVQMMDGEDQPGKRRDVGAWTSITLPYAQGQLEAVVVLPQNSDKASAPASTCQAPTPAELAALRTGRAVPSGVDLPRLDLDQSSDLTGDLAALGLPLGGDYSGFARGSYVDQVLQKTVLKLDEHGTTAAAATGVVVVTSLPIVPRADRPFYLLIQDTATGTPLFMAHITNPSATR